MERAEKRFQPEISQLKDEQTTMKKDWENVEISLRAQLGESKRAKKKIAEELKTAKRRAKLAENKLQ
jgi:hypothetical protein